MRVKQTTYCLVCQQENGSHTPTCVVGQFQAKRTQRSVDEIFDDLFGLDVTSKPYDNKETK